MEAARETRRSSDAHGSAGEDGGRVTRLRRRTVTLLTSGAEAAAGAAAVAASAGGLRWGCFAASGSSIRSARLDTRALPGCSNGGKIASASCSTRSGAARGVGTPSMFCRFVGCSSGTLRRTSGLSGARLCCTRAGGPLISARPRLRLSRLLRCRLEAASDLLDLRGASSCAACDL